MTDPLLPPPVPPAPPAAPVPSGHQAPPPGAYQVPVGGYRMPVGGYTVPAAPKPSRALGATALVASLVASLVLPIVAGALCLQIGMLVPVQELMTDAGEFVVAALSPARTETLWAEICFWAATALGLYAVIGGIVAIVRRRGRGLGIAALVIAALAPGIFFVVVGIMYGIGNGIAFDPMA